MQQLRPLVQTVCQGRAVLLNFSVANAPFQPLVEGLLAASGVTAKITACRPNGARIPGLEITRWRNQEIELVALLGDHDGEVTVHLPDSRHVYDLKKHLTLGQVEQFTTQVLPHRASFFALLPHSVAAPRMNSPNTNITLGDTVKLTLSIPAAEGNHALQLSATTPHGDSLHGFQQNLIVNRQTQTVHLPIAHNDPPGTWTVTIADLYSPERVTTAFIVDE
ncbi:MAG: hypothetical protein ABGX16_02650 [Pirellulales bacterium]